jgi:methionyl-tRNA formyltransferase
MANTPLRLVFAGTPVFAASHLQVLLGSGHQLLAAYTQPDRPAGRGKKLTASPVKQLALAAGIPVMQPASLREEAAQAELAALQADVLIVVAYGLILPQPVLDTPRLACINVHASLLPRWRGAAPIQRAIEAGDSETGITIMEMDAGLDTGKMLAQASVPIGGQTTSASLHDELALVGGPLLVNVLADLPGHLAGATVQNNDKATYAHKIEKSEAAIDWLRPAAQLQRQVRAFNPFPGSWTTLAGERIKIWNASTSRETAAPGTIHAADDSGIHVGCGEGCLVLTEIQLAGGRNMPVAEILHSRRELFAPGTTLGN